MVIYKITINFIFGVDRNRLCDLFVLIVLIEAIRFYVSYSLLVNQDLNSYRYHHPIA